MPTANSMIDKIFGAGRSGKAYATLDLQRAREAKAAQSKGADFEAVDIECNWRVALHSRPSDAVEGE